MPRSSKLPRADHATVDPPRSPLPGAAAPAARPRASPKRTETRERLEQEILDTAKKLFAQRGYGGVSLDHIAHELGVAKQNLLYYFSNKENLYRRVLHGVLDDWLSYMAAIADHADDPETALRGYIAGKLRFSREHPEGSRVFANEVIAGAPLFAQEIRDRVLPALQTDVAVFNRWAEAGVCRPVDAAHLMVVLWASTQAYADYATQICLVLDKPALEQRDFDAAEALLVDMVLRTVLIQPPPDALRGQTPAAGAAANANADADAVAVSGARGSRQPANAAR